jgi:hypothetical protein
MNDVPGTTDPTSVSIIDDPGLRNAAKNPDAMPLLKRMAPEIVCVDIDGRRIEKYSPIKNRTPFTVVRRQRVPFHDNPTFFFQKAIDWKMCCRLN